MVITALPTSAVRVIETSQSLTDSVSLVKELVDNSLDAGATAIFVEISSNTIDRIKVKDNGCGIDSEDYGVVCKRHYTSKLRSLEDLDELGGRTLGFRGEALASAAEMSSKVLLTTRTDGEPTATEIEYGRVGQVKSQKRVSHAVGTTLQVENFLADLPVRKQTGEKSSSKCLVRTKKLLQSYALARPQIRFSLKVLKAKNDKGYWSYAPMIASASDAFLQSLIHDAATKIFGRKAAEQCQWQTSSWPSSGGAIELEASRTSAVRDDQVDAYSFQAFVVRPTCTDKAVISGLGQHISIDQRPVACDRGTLKQIASCYKSCLRLAVGDWKVKDPLLVLNIVCPKGSYDMNIEPAKDDVLFTDASIVLQIAQKVFNNLYGEMKAKATEPPIVGTNSSVVLFDLLLANPKDRSLKAHSSSQPAEKEVRIQTNSVDTANGRCEDRVVSMRSDTTRQMVTDEVPQVSHHNSQDEVDFLIQKKAAWKQSICADDDSDIVDTGHLSDTPEPAIGRADETQLLRGLNVSNPWTFAKLNAPLLTNPRNHHGNVDTSINDNLLTPRRQRGDIRENDQEFSKGTETSPGTSPSSFPYPLRAFGRSRHGETEPVLRASNKELSGPTALDSWIQPAPATSSIDPSAAFRGARANQPPSPVSPDDRLSGTALRDIPDISQRTRAKPSQQRHRQEAVQNLFKSPVTDQERVWFDIGEHNEPTRHQKTNAKNTLRANPATSLDLRENLEIPAPLFITAPQPIHPDLAVTLDYEVRKAKATQDHIDGLRKERVAEMARERAKTARQRTLDFIFHPQSDKSNLNSPHKNRYTKAIAALHADSIEMPLGSSSQSSSNSHRPKTTSKRLTLEKAKSSDWVSDFVLPISIGTDAVSNEMLQAVDWDDYVYQGESLDGFTRLDVRQVHEWEGRVQWLLEMHYREEENGAGTERREDTTIDFHKVLLPEDVDEGRH